MKRFKEYTRDEAEEVASCFVAQAKSMSRAELDTELWTEWVLDWFASAAAADTVVDARRSRRIDGGRRSLAAGARNSIATLGTAPRTTDGEFLVDLCHTTFPAYQREWGSPGYWERAFSDPPSRPAMMLALESEFGSSASDDLNLHRVMEDASKLLVLRAKVKVMLFASINASSRDRILGLANKIAACDRDTATTWVWIDLPWSDSWEGPNGPTARVIPVAR